MPLCYNALTHRQFVHNHDYFDRLAHSRPQPGINQFCYHEIRLFISGGLGFVGLKEDTLQ